MKTLIYLSLSVVILAISVFLLFSNSSKLSDKKSSVFELAKNVFMEGFDEGYDTVVNKNHVKMALFELNRIKRILTAYYYQEERFPNDLDELGLDGKSLGAEKSSVEFVALLSNGVAKAVFKPRIFGRDRYVEMSPVLDGDGVIVSWQFSSNLRESMLEGTGISPAGS